VDGGDDLLGVDPVQPGMIAGERRLPAESRAGETVTGASC
jgi:hypothetical protein